jgi:hypothetical protein
MTTNEFGLRNASDVDQVLRLMLAGIEPSAWKSES